MINLKGKTFYTITGITLILLMTSINIYLYNYKKNSNLLFYEELKKNYINFKNVKSTAGDFTKIFFIYNKLECEQCIIEHLKLMNNLANNMNKRNQVKFFVSCEDSVSYFNFLKYKKIFKLKTLYIDFDKFMLSTGKMQVRLPIMMIIDENNRISNVWKADVLKLSKTKEILKNELRVN